MLFNTVEFLVFFVGIYALYLLFNHRWQNRLLIVASCLFYSAWNWKFLALMFVSITTDYFCARAISRSTQEKHRKGWLILSVCVNLGILGFFKYFNFFCSSGLDLLKDLSLLSPASTCALNIILPVGISFYTFEAISYVVDVYRRQVQPAQKYWDYLLFVIYFPHLIAGPIMRAKSFLPQITSSRVITRDLFFEGCFLFFWGLFEKMFVADNLARFVNPLFASSPPYVGSDVLIALYAFSFQIFCDFDGYSNMARGLGKCMGFDIAINFNLPYFSSNPREFWRRWHISLSTWLRDYLYIPLGGSKFGNLLTIRNLAITMLLGGLWHGAAWNFVLWGGYHFVLLGVQHGWDFMKGKSERPNDFSRGNGLWRFIRIIIFFHIVALGWLIFRAQSLNQIGDMLVGLFSGVQFDEKSAGKLVKLCAFILPLLAIQLGQWRQKDLLFLYRKHWLVKVPVYAMMAYLLIRWGVISNEEFIYFQF